MKKKLRNLIALSMLLVLAACAGEGRTDQTDQAAGTQALPQKESVENRAVELQIGENLRTGTYTGEWENDAPNGKGVFHYTIEGENGGERTITATFTDGVIGDEWKLEGKTASGVVFSYEGQVRNGKYHGSGVYTETDTDGRVVTYKGEYKDGARDGKGARTIQYADGTLRKYDGEWKEGKYHGQGVCTVTYAEGKSSKYDGEWKEGNRHGQGVCTATNADGDTFYYDGEWKADRRCGQGYQKLAFGNGEDVEEYRGEFVDDQYHGKGTLVLTSGEGKQTMEGDFKEGKPDGTIRKVTEDSKGYIVLEGQYVKGNPHGELTYTEYDLNGKELDSGTYKNGKYTSKLTKKVVSFIDRGVELLDSKKANFIWGGLKSLTGMD